MNNKELIKYIEEKRRKLYIEYREKNISKKIFKIYLDKYDNLLLYLYSKYEKKL